MAIPTDDEYAQFQLQIDLQNQKDLNKEEVQKIKEKVDEDGTVYEWDEIKRAWFPKITQDFLASYQASYGSMREPVNAPDGTVYNWNDDKKHYFNDKDQKLPDEGFLVDGVNYTYNIESSQWLADGKLLASTSDSAETYKDENGTLYFWNSVKKLWVSEAGMTYDPVTCQYMDQNTGKVYDPEKMEWVNPKKKDSDKPKVEKDGIIKTKKTPKRKAEWFEIDETENLNVYVSGMPRNYDLPKFEALMKKCGLIKPDEKTGEAKLKLYRDKEGKVKGDGLCCYLAIESVDLAIQILDGSTLDGQKISVQPAKFELKGNFDEKKKKKALKKKDKANSRKQKEKLLGWGGMGLTSGAQEAEKRHPSEKVLVFMNAFTVEEVSRDPVLIITVRDELRKICAPFGIAKRVNVFDGHPKGVASVAFARHEEADRILTNLDNKLFRGRVLSVTRWDGHTDFAIEETQAEINNRDAAWQVWLENEEDSD